jgi:hypothetical protein
MAKKLIIESEVKTDQIDKAVQKLGQLKDLGKGLKIQYDINGKPLDIVIDKSLNLQKQVKILTAELRRTKEGTAEFQLLSSRLGQAQDELAKTTAKSKDLFSTLSLLPGPVGDFFRQLQGGIELLKTFSSFTFKDLSFQFKETADDIADIGNNLSGVNSDNIEDVDDASSKLGDTLRDTATQAGGTSAALSDVAKSSTRVVDATGKVTTAAENAAAAATKEGQAIAGMTNAQVANVNTTRQATVATNQLAAAETTATVATNTLGAAIKGALIGTGIGLAIVFIGEIIGKLIEYFDNSKKAEKAANDYTEAIKRQNEVLEANLGQIDFENKKKILQAKIAGDSEKEINKLTQEGLENRYKLIRDANSAALQEQKDLAKRTGKFAKISDEERAALLDKNLENLKKLGDEETKAREAVELGKLQIQATSAEKSRKLVIETNQKSVEEFKKANDLLLKLEQENSVNRLETERKRQDEQLKIEKVNEEREVNKLKINEELKGKLLEQIRVKYALKVIDVNKKRQEEDNKQFEEDQKKLKEYQDKIFEIFNNADQNELSRNKAARTKKLEDDKAAIQNDTNFQKQSLEEKIRILLALEKAYNQDIEKLDEEDAAGKRERDLKKLDDELRFLQIRGEAIRKGTIEYFDNLRTISKKAEERELKDLDDRAIKEKLTTEQVEAEKTAIKKKYANERNQINKQEVDSYLQYGQAILGAASNIFSSISNINNMQQEQDLQKAEGNAAEQDKIKEKYFYKNRDAQYNQALISTAQSAISAYSSLAVIPVVGVPLGILAAGAAILFGKKQADLIRTQKYQGSGSASSATPPKPELANFGRNYEKGGMIGGRRHAEGGTLIEAEKGEAIMTRGAVATFGPLLSLMNQAGGGTSFNSNLLTTRQDNPVLSNPTQEQSPLIVKTYVVSQELTTEAQKQARLKNLSTL